MSFLIMSLFATFVACVTSEMCGPCICQDSLAICYVRSCSSVLVKSPDVEILRIFGKICETHITVLQDEIYHNTIVELMDSSCGGRINNCRDNSGTVNPTSTSTTKKYPLPPAEKKNDGNDEIDDDDDDDREEDEEITTQSVTTTPMTITSVLFTTFSSTTASRTETLPLKVDLPEEEDEEGDFHSDEEEESEHYLDTEENEEDIDLEEMFESITYSPQDKLDEKNLITASPGINTGLKKSDEVEKGFPKGESEEMDHNDGSRDVGNFTHGDKNYIDFNEWKKTLIITAGGMGSFIVLLLICLLRKRIRMCYYRYCCCSRGNGKVCECVGKNKKKLKDSDETLFEQTSRKKEGENKETKILSRACCCCMPKLAKRIPLETLGPTQSPTGSTTNVSTTNDTSSEEIP